MVSIANLLVYIFHVDTSGDPCCSLIMTFRNIEVSSVFSTLNILDFTNNNNNNNNNNKQIYKAT